MDEPTCLALAAIIGALLGGGSKEAANYAWHLFAKKKPTKRPRKREKRSKRIRVKPNSDNNGVK